MRLDGRIAVVTAGGSGMGRAGSLKLAEEGATVIVTDLDAEAAAETASLIEAAGGKAESRSVDVLDHSQLEELFKDVENDHGKLHILWNHAGAPGPAGLAATEESFDFAMNLNVKSAYFATALAEDLLAAADGKASVIFTSSVSGLVGSPGSPVYSLAKGGISTMTKALAISLAPKGIRVNAICPAAVETPMLIKFFDRSIESEEEAKKIQLDYIKVSVPLGRAGTAEEVANVVAFLASDDSSFITGVPLPVDGGYTAK